MRSIEPKIIAEKIAKLCIRANTFLRPDVYSALLIAYKKERSLRSKKILKAIIDNAVIAKKEKIAICQDTGMPVVFIELGQEIRVLGDLKRAVNKGVKSGYTNGYLRDSIVTDPLVRGASGYTPAVIHIDTVRGKRLKITLLPKGFGCENKSRLKMFKPTADKAEIIKFIVEAVKDAGPDACPPYVIGVGLGGTADYACLLAKKALLRNITIRNTQYAIRKLENDLFKSINRLNIGPMGLGGKTTVLAVNIEAYPTHIAGLPVAVNVSCHALRSASVSL